MSTVIYYLMLPFLYLVSYLPFQLMYVISDLFYLLIYRMIGYRKSVVTENLQNSFPEKSADEINSIRDGFYHYLCDLSLETLKTLSVSPPELKKHFTSGDLSVLDHYYKQNQSVIIVMGHLGSWELGGQYFTQLPLHQLYVIYHPLANQRFDSLLYKMRTRLGVRLYPMKGAFRGMIKNRKEASATAFIADQTPTTGNGHWMKFMNQDTSIFKGTEVIARKLDYPVIYLSVIRQKRGQYRLESELLVEHPQELAENELTEMHTRRLEQDIINYPETWLWSHRRWKHKKSAQQPSSDNENK
jgi:KDO2-lipid IV(A) lauroyltransferase